MPTVFALLAKRRSTAREMGVSRPSGSKRKKLRTSGKPSVRSCKDVPKLRSGSRLWTKVSDAAEKVNVIGGVVAVAEALKSETFPASSRARTAYSYVCDGATVASR
jgi:hypothetical protein